VIHARRSQHPAQPAPPDMPSGLLSGWLRKRGAGSGPLGSTEWRQRWFILDTEGCVRYFKTRPSKPSEAPAGSFCVKGAEVRATSATDLEIQARPLTEGKDGAPMTQKSRAFHLQAESAEVSERWFSALQTAAGEDSKSLAWAARSTAAAAVGDAAAMLPGNDTAAPAAGDATVAEASDAATATSGVAATATAVAGTEAVAAVEARPLGIGSEVPTLLEPISAELGITRTPITAHAPPLGPPGQAMPILDAGEGGHVALSVAWHLARGPHDGAPLPAPAPTRVDCGPAELLHRLITAATQLQSKAGLAGARDDVALGTADWASALRRLADVVDALEAKG